mmetsp:Transcript_8833/g.12906  ORF Transcript_8833/g.12906 Transcript_8833/m.12906 type:complete len:99 (+) Transcript_8833:335-631(+)
MSKLYCELLSARCERNPIHSDGGRRGLDPPRSNARSTSGLEEDILLRTVGSTNSVGVLELRDTNGDDLADNMFRNQLPSALTDETNPQTAQCTVVIRK